MKAVLGILLSFFSFQLAEEPGEAADASMCFSVKLQLRQLA